MVGGVGTFGFLHDDTNSVLSSRLKGVYLVPSYCLVMSSSSSSFLTSSSLFLSLLFLFFPSSLSDSFPSLFPFPGSSPRSSPGFPNGAGRVFLDCSFSFTFPLSDFLCSFFSYRYAPGGAGVCSVVVLGRCIIVAILGFGKGCLVLLTLFFLGVGSVMLTSGTLFGFSVGMCADAGSSNNEETFSIAKAETALTIFAAFDVLGVGALSCVLYLSEIELRISSKCCSISSSEIGEIIFLI